ncbi:hypothetical protein Cni_G22844 [Canna indica]|uniref:Transcription elongation factor SPT5 n=1 Tax=Canna indica TaxID=4628 RepID=A0AAQ3KSJ1_9LILI|nr:hypothetical protein Cni_G22844 [Canna indica]
MLLVIYRFHRVSPLTAPCSPSAMACGRRRKDDDFIDDDEEDEGLMDDEEEDDEEYDGGKSGRKRQRSEFIDDVSVEDDEEEEEEDEDDGGRRGKKPKRRSGSEFFELEAMVDSDEEEEEEEGEDDFINDAGADLPDDYDDNKRLPHRPILIKEDQEDIEEMERQVKEWYSKSNKIDYAEDATDVEQQALLPSVKDPKLWMVKCAIGHERETAICLMQKFIDKPYLQIKSVIALYHLKNYIYVEAEKEAHVKEACKGLRNIFSSSKVMIVPIKEMTDVLSVESKAVDLSRDTWVRMKIGIYKGDLAKVVDVDNVCQRVTVKLIPRVDLQTLANKLEGRDIGKKTFVPPRRFFNIDEASEMHIRVERRRDKYSGEYFEMVNGLMFRDGFLYKTVSVKSISSQNIQPTFDELEKFRKPGEDSDGDVASLSTLFANRKKGNFMKGDAVIVVRGDSKKLMGWVEKVEEDTVHIRPKMKGLPKTLAFNEKELCKYFKPGDHVKVVSGVQEGATGMVVKVEGHVLIILSNTTNEHLRIFADHVVKSSESTTGVTRVGDYELHDLVLLVNKTFGVIIRVESEAFQVLKGVPDRPEVVLVKLREIKCKIERRSNAKDRSNNIVSAKDVVWVVEGPCRIIPVFSVKLHGIVHSRISLASSFLPAASPPPPPRAPSGADTTPPPPRCSAKEDDVLRPVLDLHVPIRVDDAQVVGQEPTVLERRVGVHDVLVVSLHDVVVAKDNLAKGFVVAWDARHGCGVSDVDVGEGEHADALSGLEVSLHVRRQEVPLLPPLDTSAGPVASVRSYAW